MMVKRLTILFILLSSFCGSVQAARIISSWDIARWYLDADLVVVCHVKDVKTIIVHRADSVDFEGFRVQLEIIKEKYTLSIDSVLKGNPKLNETPEAFTPRFLSNYSRQKETKEYKGLNASGDSIFVMRVEVPGYENYDNNDYFRLPFEGKSIVILKRNNLGYEIIHKQNYTKDFLSFLNDVKIKGEDYFPPFKELK